MIVPGVAQDTGYSFAPLFSFNRNDIVSMYGDESATLYYLHSKDTLYVLTAEGGGCRLNRRMHIMGVVIRKKFIVMRMIVMLLLMKKETRLFILYIMFFYQNRVN